MENKDEFQPPQPPRFFSERNYAVPFGRYQPGGDTGPPANEVLVGRAGQRAYFIDLLFRMGRRGAFLVTGHRGVGKTSFVKHCLSVHREEVFERFLNSNVGRATFWDRLGVMIIGFIVLVVLSMISQLIEVLTLRLGPLSSPLLWIVLMPLVLICLYPMLFAWEILREILDYNSSVLSIITVFMAGLLWLLPPFGSPVIALTRFLAVIGFLYFWAHCLRFDPSTTSDGSRQKIGRNIFLLIGLILAAIFMMSPMNGSKSQDQWNELWLNIGLALFGLGLGGALRSLLLFKTPSEPESSEEDSPVAPSPPYWYLGSGLFCILGALLTFLCSRPQIHPVQLSIIAGFPLGVGILACLLFTIRGETKHKVTSFQPQPRFVLFLKAILCVIITLQLLHPVIVRGTGGIANREHSLLEGVGFAGNIPKALCEVQDLETLFFSKTDEIAWVAALFFCLLGLYYLEYEWIVRPFLRERSRPADKPAPWDDQISGEPANDGYRSLARVTMPWVLFKAWLPILTISVNLGFEKLDHRRVVHAMLAGLRDQYHKTFLSWGSVLANLFRILGVLAVLALTNLIGRHWFELPKVNSTEASYLQANDYKDICHFFRGAQAGPATVNVVCKLPGGDTFVKILYYNFFEDSTSSKHRGEHLLFELLLPFRKTPWPAEGGKPFLTQGAHFEIYHLLLFLFLMVAGRWLLGRLPILPYRETVRRIDEVMDFLSARTSVTSRTNRWEPVQVLQGWLMDERTRQTEQDPADPRTVEFLFLQILNDIQSTYFHLGGARDQLVSLPTPEVTFLFDELDKLGTRVDPDEREAGGGPQQAEILHAERKRSMELHKLLADMKNLLSSAPARFIFVGGRNLHDEWLADQSARQPLLTNIFNAEVYLPSLVTDLGRLEINERTLDRNIRIYFKMQLRRAERVFAEAQRKQLLPSLALPIEENGEELFASHKVKQEREKDKDKNKDNDDRFRLHASDTGGTEPDEPFPTLLFRDFYQFLTYRSMGNPKRLKELLGTFVRPVERAVKDTEMRWAKNFRDCDHVLAFGDTERFRIQLLARIYRHLILSFEHRLVRRDDKLAISVFFLADFLFKFHRRAFSWSNLERVDELVHIHRAPDLREILESMVSHWSERFLHPIRNGMYDFRFRSDLAREVEYISRQSHEEMAAFNFTLDESQALKSAYSTNIAFLKEKIGREPIDMVAGLGELHEFDQEYEEARVYYRRAIVLLDERLREISGEIKFSENKGPEDDADSSPIFAAFAATRRGIRLNRNFLTWGITRLRLMLQIGMTFELARNFERAGIEYRNAHTLASSLRMAMVDREDEICEEGRYGLDEFLHSLKHLNIIFQPVFAEAWVAEKLTAAVDTSVSLIEKELWTLRAHLPFVKDLQLKAAASPVGARGSNFSLIVAELHNKAGDLYFFKGRQRVTLDGLKQMLDKPSEGETRHGHEGYLLRAHYHYAVALHELSRLITYRRVSSPNKLNIWTGENDPPWETIDKENWPDFLYRSAGGCLHDLAEAMLGRVSLYGLLDDVKKRPGNGKRSFREVQDSAAQEKRNLTAAFISWMESAPISQMGQAPNQEEIPILLDREPVQAGPLQSWFGRWTARTEILPGLDYFPLIEFKSTDHHNDYTRLLASLRLKLVGSKMLEKGGYIEDAALELEGVCEAATHYLWWIMAIRRLLEWAGKTQVKGTKGKHLLEALTGAASPLETIKGVAPPDSQAAPGCWSDLAAMALYSLKKADLLFRLGRKAEDKLSGSYLIGDKIPVTQLMLTCSLGLAVENWKLDDGFRKEISTLLRSWGALNPTESADQATLRRLLEDTLLRHSYPMVNRLHRLKLLIDDSLLGEGELDSRWESWIEELKKLTADLEAPMHFTPLHSGTTYALAYLRSLLYDWAKEKTQEEIDKQQELEDRSYLHSLLMAQYSEMDGFLFNRDLRQGTKHEEKRQQTIERQLQECKARLATNQELRGKREEERKIREEEQRKRETWLRRAAQRDLETSEEMFTLRRAYYENISDLSYLYDDFNDRQLHLTHGIQMAGAELNALLKYLVTTEDYVPNE